MEDPSGRKDAPNANVLEIRQASPGRATRPLTARDAAIAAIFAVGAAYVEYGFFHADPLLTTMLKVVRAALILVTPLAGLGVGWLYVNVRRGRVPPMAVAALAMSAAVVALLAIPAAMTARDRHLRPNLAEYHPFLQLSPPDVKERPAPAGQTPVKIFCVGGSTTEFGDAKGRHWTDLLETELQRHSSGRPIQVYNLGRQWYTSEHILINYAINLRQHQPAVLVVMEAINDLLPNADFSNLSLGPFRDDYRHFLGPLYRVIRRDTFWGSIGEMAGRLWFAHPREVVDADRFPGLAPYERNLRTLIDYARADGVAVVLMTQPTLLKEKMTRQEEAALIMANFEAVGPTKRWSRATAWRGMTQYNDAVRRVAAQTGAPLIDLEKAIPKTTEYFSDDVHYHAPAIDKIAATIAEEFQKQKIL